MRYWQLRYNAYALLYALRRAGCWTETTDAVEWEKQQYESANGR